MPLPRLTARTRRAHRSGPSRWTLRSRRTIITAIAVASVGATGAAAAAGHAPWPTSSGSHSTAGADRGSTAVDAPTGGLDSDQRGNERGAPPATPAPEPVEATTVPASIEPTSEETTVPPSSEPSSTEPSSTAAPTTVAMAEPVTLPPSTTAAPAPAEPAPATTAPAPAPAPTPPPPPPPSPAGDTRVPQTLSLSCSVDGTTVSCSFTGTPGTGFQRSLLLRGMVGADAGRVLLSTPDTAGSYVDAGLAPGTYLYTAIALDSLDHNLGRSNQISITIVGPTPGG